MTAPSKDDQADNLELVKYIAGSDASLLESRSLGGFTPLHLACTRRSKDVIAALISMGAKVRSRDATGRNMIHHLICPPGDNTAWTIESEKKNSFSSFLSLFDKRDVKEMLLERDILGYTPFAFWQWQGHNKTGEAANSSTIPEVVSSYTDGQHLTIMNSVGDFPIHVAIKQGRPLHVREFLSQTPQTLGYENATGITALELAQDKLQSATVEGLKMTAKSRGRDWRNQETYTGLVAKDWREFEPKAVKSEDFKGTLKAKLFKGDIQELQAHRWVLEECLEVAEKVEAEGASLKRRLVSLGEANEIARRMLVAQKKEEVPSIYQHYYNASADEGSTKVDWDEIVTAMTNRALQGWTLRGRAVVNIV